jgi:hypothetical protein
MEKPPFDVQQDRPQGDETWPIEVLAHIRQVSVGDVPIAVHLNDGSTLPADLEEVTRGKISLDLGESTIELEAKDIHAFTLLDPEPPLDRSDEIGHPGA